MKSMRKVSVLVIFLGAVIQGCALKPQNVHLDPEVEYAKEVSPSEVLIGFSVADDRPTKKLGEIGDAHQAKVDVTLNEDFVPLLTERLTAGIEQRGFMVDPDDPTVGRTLTIKVDNLALNSVKMPMTFRTELRADVTAVAATESGVYERVYYVQTSQDTAGPPYEGQTNKLINEAMSQALTAVMNDDKLFEALTR
ncbi:MAG: hypothetical protein JSU95_00195 [Betaproteobacteria bacterium]|nr:MAG: hypothetical protein JSU95_00195 [Betaproteobacteria bacterium]